MDQISCSAVSTHTLHCALDCPLCQTWDGQKPGLSARGRCKPARWRAPLRAAGLDPRLCLQPRLSMRSTPRCGLRNGERALLTQAVECRYRVGSHHIDLPCHQVLHRGARAAIGLELKMRPGFLLKERADDMLHVAKSSVPQNHIAGTKQRHQITVTARLNQFRKRYNISHSAIVLEIRNSVRGQSRVRLQP
jgi:hypothetical protein